MDRMRYSACGSCTESVRALLYLQRHGGVDVAFVPEGLARPAPWWQQQQQHISTSDSNKLFLPITRRGRL